MTRTKCDQDRFFDQAVSQYAGALSRLASAYEADADRRLDLLQDIQIALWRSFANYDGRCSLKTWVYRVAHNRATTYMLSQKRIGFSRLNSIEDFEIESNAPSPDIVAENSNAIAAIRNIIEQLQPPDRQIMLLYLDDLGGNEIAEIAGISAGTVATKISRFKSLLSRKYSNHGDKL